MGRSAIQLALRAAGVGGDLSIALAADLDESWEASGTPSDEGSGSNFGRGRIEPAAHGHAEVEASWELPFLVADADVCGGFGDLCGRRVA